MAAPKVRRLGWLHQPSFKAGQSGTRNAGLVGPTQHSTVYAPRHPPRPEECSQLPPPLQGQRLGWHPRSPATCQPTTARTTAARREGKECVSNGKSRGSPETKKKKTK